MPYWLLIPVAVNPCKMALGFVRKHVLMPSPGPRMCQSDLVSSAACNTAEDLIRAAHPEIDESQPDAEASQGKLRATAVPPATKLATSAFSVSDSSPHLRFRLMSQEQKTSHFSMFFAGLHLAPTSVKPVSSKINCLNRSDSFATLLLA